MQRGEHPNRLGGAVAGATLALLAAACAPTLAAGPRPTPPAAPPSQSGPTAPLTPAPDVPGDPNRGYALVLAKGCGGCHSIRGVPGALGVAGPNLTNVTLRPTLAGEQIRMSPDTLAAWLVNPAAVKPNAAMPNLGLTQAEARDVAAYLYSQPYNPVAQ